MSAEQTLALSRRFFNPLALLSIAVLLVCALYAYAFLVLVPYTGFDYDGSWVILDIDKVCNIRPEWCAEVAGSLRVGDQMLVIGNLTFQQYRDSRAIVPFAGFRPGDAVPVTFLRDGEVQHTVWHLLGPIGSRPFLRALMLLPFLPLWIAGTVVLLFIRPRDNRWRLLTLFYYGFAIWWAAGASSSAGVLGSSVLMHCMTWLLLPISIHLHLAMPTTFSPRLQRYVLPPLYVFGGTMAVLELRDLLPRNAYGMALLFTVVVSLSLLIVRLLRRDTPPAARLVDRLMLFGAALAIGPGLVLWVIPSISGGQLTSVFDIYVPTLAAFSLPFSYIYALYKHRLGTLEFRANRLLSMYAFITVYVGAFAMVFAFGTRWIEFGNAALWFTIVTTTFFVACGLVVRGPFQRMVDRLAYGTEHNPEDIIGAFANQIPRALNRGSLVHLLTAEVAPSLLIRQSALYLIAQGAASLVYSDGIPGDDGVEVVHQVDMLAVVPPRYRPAEAGSQGPLDWVRLAIPIEVSGQLVAIWLLGGRDPDDYYPKSDIDLLLTLSNQIGVALETTRLFENLQQHTAELERAYGELQQLDELKDEFVQNVSHELRTPLTFVRGYTELMLDGALGPLTSEQRPALETIVDRTDGIIRLVNDIISIQQAALEPIEPEPVDVLELVRSSVATARVLAQKAAREGHDYQIELDLPDEAPEIWGDRGRLGQVLDNLLNNAMKFSPYGGLITVRVRCGRTGPGGNGASEVPPSMVEISVGDRGIGIPADQLDRIWERFYQVDGSSTRRFGGVGLGLAIVRNILKAHGGRIWVESQQGVGSTFHFLLPLQRAHPQASALALAQATVNS